VGKVKGTAVAGRLGYVRARHGEAAVLRMVAAITDPAAREQLADGRALKSQWYPFSVLVDISVALDREFGRGDLSLLEEVGGDVAEADLSGVYKIFFRVANPHFIVDRAASVWRNYYSSGDCVVVAKEEKAVTLEVREFDQPHRAHCLAVLGWTKRTLVLTGCQGVTGRHTECRTTGGQVCRFEGRWR